MQCEELLQMIRDIASNIESQQLFIIDKAKLVPFPYIEGYSLLKCGLIPTAMNIYIVI